LHESNRIAKQNFIKKDHFPDWFTEYHILELCIRKTSEAQERKGDPSEISTYVPIWNIQIPTLMLRRFIQEQDYFGQDSENDEIFEESSSNIVWYDELFQLKDSVIEWKHEYCHVEKRAIYHIREVVRLKETELTPVFEETIQGIQWFNGCGYWWEAIEVFIESLECVSSEYAKAVVRGLSRGYKNARLNTFIPPKKYTIPTAEQFFIDSGILDIAYIEADVDIQLCIALGRPIIINAILDHLNLNTFKCVCNHEIADNETDLETILKSLSTNRISVTLSSSDLLNLISNSETNDMKWKYLKDLLIKLIEMGTFVLWMYEEFVTEMFLYTEGDTVEIINCLKSISVPWVQNCNKNFQCLR
jgi:hypothetical protein